MVRSWQAVLLVAILDGGALLAGDEVTTRISLDSGEREGHSPSYTGAISADGRYVAFFSYTDRLAPGAPEAVPGALARLGGRSEVFVRDRLAGETILVSPGLGGTHGDDGSYRPVISANGRYVAFLSYASNLVPGDTNGVADVFVSDLEEHAIERVSVTSHGEQADAASYFPAISADGRFVVFYSWAENLLPESPRRTQPAAGAVLQHRNVFLRDRLLGTTELISVNASGDPGNDHSDHAVVSSDGRWIAFRSFASDLVPNDTNQRADIFLRDRVARRTLRVSVATGGGQASGASETPAISIDGKLVAFSSTASDLVAGDTNGTADVFVHEAASGTTTRVSVDSTGHEGDLGSTNPSLSAYGRYVVFLSFAGNLVSGDTNGSADVFRHDRKTGTTTRVSVGAGGNQPDGDCEFPVISADGRQVAFTSEASNLVPGDRNDQDDVFVHGAELVLDASSLVVAAGERLTLTLFTGPSGNAAALFLVERDGAPLFVPLLIGPLDHRGHLALGTTVPTGFSGLELGFQGQAIGTSGEAIASDRVTVFFK